MQLFDEYIAPLTTWLQVHSGWALFITFLISFAESLAIVGSIVPGSVTMTAIGILAGSGIMRIDLTYLFAILGAIAGDVASYELGYLYKDSIAAFWPFKKYPKWLLYGKDYFAKHGGKSVLIGRFAGPLRSIIPVIAGMMGMHQWRFFIANVISAIGWALLYVTPGVLIGMASTELSAESATRLCVFILLILFGVWVITVLIKRLIATLGIFFQKQLQQFLQRLNKNRYFSRFFHYLTPPSETNHYYTAVLLLLFFIAFATFLTLLILTALHTGLALLNTPVHLLFQSIRISAFDKIAIVFIQVFSTITLSGLVVASFIYFSCKRNYTGLVCLTGLLFTNIALLVIINLIIHTPWPILQVVYKFSGSSCPAAHLMLATSLLVFFTCYLHNIISVQASLITRYIVCLLLLFSGIASLYLGDHWLTDVLLSWLAGIATGLGFWILYRKNIHEGYTSFLKAEHFFMLLLLLIALSTTINFNKTVKKHRPSTHTFLLSEPVWWDQQRPLLPFYRNNRLGKKVGLMNVQYVGSISKLQKQLLIKGWENYSDTLFVKLLKRTNGKPEDKVMPLFPQLFENKYPALVMTLQHDNPDFILILSLWQSGYYLNNITQPIWIGSVQQALQYTENEAFIESQDPITWLVPSLQGFSFRRLSLRLQQKPDSIPTLPDLLLIRE